MKLIFCSRRSPRVLSLASSLWTGVGVTAAVAVLLVVGGCASSGDRKSEAAYQGISLRGVSEVAPATSLNDAAASTEPGSASSAVLRGMAVEMNHGGAGSSAVEPGASGAIQLSCAGREWVNVVVELNGLGDMADRSQLALQLAPPRLSGDGSAAPPAVEVAAYQLVDMPIDGRRADYVRHVGAAPKERWLPRALLPLKKDQDRFLLSDLFSFPTTGGPSASPQGDQGLAKPSINPNQSATGRGPTSFRFWVDLRVAAKTTAGLWQTHVDLVRQVPTRKGQPATWKSIQSLPIDLTVQPFDLPEQRTLKMVANVGWDELTRHFHGEFARVTPHLLQRKNPIYARTVQTLDGLMRVTQQNRLSLAFPALRPSVKWPEYPALPDDYWDDFDEMVGPWFNGEAFEDHVPVDYWPLPEAENLSGYDSRSRTAYWTQAANHFDLRGWLDRAAVQLSAIRSGRAESSAIELSSEAERVFSSHPRVQVGLPLEDEQVQVDDPTDPHPNQNKIDPLHARRLLTAAAGPIAGTQSWPENITEPKRWLRADLPGIVQLEGAGGDEHDVRLWAWLAFLRRVDGVMFGRALPTLTSPTEAADPSELIWLYPGEWFGRDEPVQTVQLKWLRAAEQDYEYLALSRKCGEGINALVMARLLTKPVEVGNGQAPDASYTLMTGTTDDKVWVEARQLLAKLISAHGREGRDAITQETRDVIENEILQWTGPQERPLLIGRNATWTLAKHSDDGGQWVNLLLGLDVYNASDVLPEKNTLQWKKMPPGWRISPYPTTVPKLDTYHILRTNLGADFNVRNTTLAAADPVEVELMVDSEKGRLGAKSRSFRSPLNLSLPIANSVKRPGTFKFDGKLDDWDEADKIQDGPLVKMLSRPDVLAQSLPRAQTTTKLYTNWGGPCFYLGFALEGLSPIGTDGSSSSTNFADYQARRAWGEDLCEVLVQPVYLDNSLGPILHLVFKPNGGIWVERKVDARFAFESWESFESTGTKYAWSVKNDKWTGEVAIPWQALAARQFEMPAMLRFNFCQHRSAAGESASWAGPIDFGRDDGFTGLIYLQRDDSGNISDANPGEPRTPRVIER